MPYSQKIVWATFFFFFFCLFFSPKLILQFTEGVQWFYYRENYTFPRIQMGSNMFQGWGPSFSRGVQMLISIETHITFDFQGGGGGPDPLSPPLNPHMNNADLQIKSLIYSLIIGINEGFG